MIEDRLAERKLPKAHCYSSADNPVCARVPSQIAPRLAPLGFVSAAQSPPMGWPGCAPTPAARDDYAGHQTRSPLWQSPQEFNSRRWHRYRQELIHGFGRDELHRRGSTINRLPFVSNFILASHLGRYYFESHHCGWQRT